MFSREKRQNPKLEKAIDILLDAMAEDGYDSDEYPKMVNQLTKLYAMREQTARKRISPDTMIVVVGNLVGIVLILNHERLNVISTKAIGFVLRARS